MQQSEETIALPDGRTLGFAQFGDRQGRPVFYFHGFPGSRLEAQLGDEVARRRGIRLIAVDRPGYGCSSPQPGRHLLDWPPDVAALAEALGIERFAVLGVSGGAPFALACAAHLKEHIPSVALVCPLGPLDDPVLFPQLPWGMRFLAQSRHRFPAPARWFGRFLLHLVRQRPERALKILSFCAPAADRQVLRRSEILSTLNANAREAFRQQGLGTVPDLQIYLAPWGFALEEIEQPLVLWHGTADRTVPRPLVDYLVAHLPDCTLRLVEGEGHFSLPVNCLDRILADLG